MHISTKEEKPMKRCPTSVVTRKRQRKIKKKKRQHQCWQGYKASGTLSDCWWGNNRYNVFGKHFFEVKHAIAIQLNNPLLGVYPRGMKDQCHTHKKSITDSYHRQSPRSISQTISQITGNSPKLEMIHVFFNWRMDKLWCTQRPEPYSILKNQLLRLSQGWILKSIAPNQSIRPKTLHPLWLHLGHSGKE